MLRAALDRVKPKAVGYARPVMHARYRSALAISLVVASLGLAVGAGPGAAGAAGAAASGSAPAVARARFRSGDRDQLAGTVFFLETHTGVVAVGAAHSFDLAALAGAPEVVFELGRSKRPVARATRFLTTPGLPFAAPGGTLRGDFVVFALDAPPQEVRVLRAGPAARDGERVTLLGIPGSIPRDEDDIYGRVTESNVARVLVLLDVAYDLRGWGGAPILSSEDGRVVGVVQAAGPSGSTLEVSASPIEAVLTAAATPLDGGRGRPFARFGSASTANASAVSPAPVAEDDSPERSEAARSEPQASEANSRGTPQQPTATPQRRTRAPSATKSSTKTPLLPNEVVEKQPLFVEIEYPGSEAVLGDDHGAFVAGRALAPVGEYRKIDVVFVIDTSGSTQDPSGADVNGNGVVGDAPLGGVGSLFGVGTQDPGDSILAAEVAAARRFLARLDPRSTRVGLVTFAGDPPLDGGFVIGASDPGAPALTEVALTTHYEEVQRALDRVLARGPSGLTHIAAGVDQATIELRGLRGAFSKADPSSQKVVIFLTDGQPTLPCRMFQDPSGFARSSCGGFGAEQQNVEAVLRSARRAERAGVRVFTFGIGEEALAGPLAIVRTAEITGGTFTPVRDPATLGDVIEAVDLANLDGVTVRNVTNGKPASAAETTPDGSWSALVPLEPGRNEIEATARASDGRIASARVVVHYAPGNADPPVPELLLSARNRLLEERLIDLKRARISVEEQKAEEVRKQLQVEIARERAKAQDRADAQRKELEVKVEKPEPEAPATP